MQKREVHTSPVREVAAGIVFNEKGQFLLAQRPVGKSYAGHWEFPGGKLEAGESAQEALERELKEELGISVQGCVYWKQLEHPYPKVRVRLFFYKVHAWDGVPAGLEGQVLAWQNLPVTVSPLLAAMAPVLAWLKEEEQTEMPNG